MNKRGNGKLLESKLVDVMTFKTLIEVIKDFLGDIIIEFKQDPEMNTKEDTSESQERVPRRTAKSLKIEKKALKGKTKAKVAEVKEVEEDTDAEDVDAEEDADADDADEADDADDTDDADKNAGKNAGKGATKNASRADDEAPQDSDEDDDEDGAENTERDTETNKGGEDQSKKDQTGGVKIVAINYTRTLLILVKLDAREFSIFRVTKPIYDVGINLLQLHKLIKSLDKDDILTISIDEEDTQMLILDVENEVKNSRTRNRLKMLDINKKSYKIPATKFDVTITMDAVDFHKICKEMNQIAEYVEILCKENSITFTCKGDCSEKSTTLDASETNGIKIKFANPKKKVIVQGIFELKHFVMFSKCATLCPNIQIYMKNNYPIFIKYTVAKLGHVLLGLIPITDTNINNNFSDDEEEYSDDEKQVAMIKP